MASNQKRPPPDYLPRRASPGARAYTYVYQDGRQTQIALPGGWGSLESWREFHRVAGRCLEGLPITAPEKRGSSRTRPESPWPSLPLGFKSAIKRLLKLYRAFQTEELDSACLERVVRELTDLAFHAHDATQRSITSALTLVSRARFPAWITSAWVCSVFPARLGIGGIVNVTET